MLARNSSTLIEQLIALLILVIVLNILFKPLILLQQFPDYLDQRQTLIGILQLRRALSLGHSFEVKSDQLCMNYRDERTCFYLSNRKLIQTPGTQVYLVSLNLIRFYIEKSWIKLDIEIDQSMQTYTLIYVP